MASNTTEAPPLLAQILSEDYKTLPELAAQFFPDGSPKPKTLYKWAQSGVHGVRLEAARLGGTLVSSSERMAAFLEATQRRGASA